MAEFYKRFEGVRHCHFGGTIQHLLYPGIIHNFPEGEEPVDHLVDCIDGIETMMIEEKILSSDFDLLIGRKQ